MFKLLFLTSNRTKFQHARYLCRKHDIDIILKSDYGVAYNEPRIPDRDNLLNESIKNAIERRLKKKQKLSKTQKDVYSMLDEVFFIEDTSVIINALSTSSEEVPGTEIKFWMKEHDFTSVDKLLKEHGNDRRVIVRSDILLYLPKYWREGEGYKRFTSAEYGTITEKEYNIKTNDLYPWLDNKSFNKWFVPQGCKYPISMLPIKDADQYDFRAGAFKKMLTFLDIKIKNSKKENIIQKTLSLFDTPAFLVCGLPCAGKTTLGEFLSDKYNYYHIEASDFMHLSFYERHGINSSVNIADFAEKVLIDSPSIVVEQTLSHLDKIKDVPFIITGFRSPKEVEIFISNYKGLNKVYQIFIGADFEKRFQRNLKRKRKGDIDTEKEFRDRDSQQIKMGLQKIKTKLKSDIIYNNSDFNSYYNSFLKKYPQISESKNKILSNIPKERPKDLEDAILLALLRENQYLTTTEIAHKINDCFPNSIKTNKNNVSRYFNQRFHPYFEIHSQNNKIKYRLCHTGRSKAMLLIKNFL
ncbi:MAG: non-canonical purine NTP pyrophosphatase [Phycisphaerae bacterium]|jgi:dephospho-CoA kinase/inosine/xanthosine triphosphate pyrophosphatase family protein